MTVKTDPCNQGKERSYVFDGQRKIPQSDSAVLNLVRQTVERLASLLFKTQHCSRRFPRSLL
jgi:hypothetical protein